MTEPHRSWQERWVRAVVRWIPRPILESPERVLVNLACLVIGVSAVAVQRSTHSLLARWPDWAVVEWSAAMGLGGACALVGYWRAREPLARVGYLLIGVAALVYAASAVWVFGWRAVPVAVLYVAIALAKGLRILLGSSVRNVILERSRGWGHQ